MKKRKLFYITHGGIEFKYKGEPIMWMYPWKREKFAYRWLSFCFEATFRSLKHLDNLWEEYFEAERKIHEDITDDKPA